MSIDDNLHVMHIASGDLWAGAEAQLATLAAAQQHAGLARVSAVLFNHGRLERELRDAGIEVTVFDESRSGAFGLVWQVAAELRRLRPDMVHTHRQKENVLGGFAASITGIPSVRTQHGDQEYSLPWFDPRSLVPRLDRFTGNRIQRGIIAVTEDLADKLCGQYRPERIHVIENGLDTGLLDRLQPAGAHDDGVTDIGIVGRLVPVKRVDLFLETAALLLTGNPGRRLRFHVYGDGPLTAPLRAQAESLGITDAVTFHGHTNDIHRRIAALDVLLICSDHEGLPMTLLEAMLLETAIVAHAVGGIPRVLDHGRCGTLVEAHDAAAYASALQRIIDADASVPDVARGKERVEERYSAQANARATTGLYLRLLQR